MFHNPNKSKQDEDSDQQSQADSRHSRNRGQHRFLCGVPCAPCSAPRPDGRLAASHGFPPGGAPCATQDLSPSLMSSSHPLTAQQTSIFLSSLAPASSLLLQI
ncbi:hypothetical protein Nepgr_009390 [Nepenthes gracilis]|uniref:Uncharacterized protein n=1 Tax=Nepenthes gracilis TaxID=150966 RepID=A0AAD3SAI1_NEPGR|nr:hypothetical protein Nepgr_009390 [Nepenthes gracilis]